VLIVIGMILLGMVSFSLGRVQGEKMQKIADTLGLWSALPLGAIFALALCPTTAATFLAAIALASQFQSNLLFPMVFGVCAAIPVLVFAGIIALNAQLLGKAFSVMSQIDRWTRTIAGILFIVVGVWFSLRYVYEVF